MLNIVYQLLAEAYVNAYRKRETNYAVLEEIDSILKDLVLGLTFVDTLINLTQNDEELAFIAAGPLEDLFLKHYASIFEPLDQILKKSVQMRKALTGIWINHAKAKLVLAQLLHKYHLQSACL